MTLLARLLMKNVSKSQLAGFLLSNLAGMAIVIASLQLYTDMKPIWESSDSFLKKDYMVVNKQITSLQRAGSNATSFSAAEIDELRRQPWVRSVGQFRAADFRVTASLAAASGRGLSTFMFMESLPAGYVDVEKGSWYFNSSSPDMEVPIIISKDYLALYNFGFASSAGLPQVSEGMLGSVPMELTVSSDDGMRVGKLKGRIAGYSNRLNTILVPEEFMTWASGRYGTGARQQPSRLIIDVSSPGDAAIAPYLEAHGYEVAGDKSASSASFLVNVTTMVIVSVGVVITLLSFFILLLSISLLMQKHRAKIRTLIYLGYPLSVIASPYRKLIAGVSVGALLLSVLAMLLLRHYYLPGIESLGGGEGGLWLSVGAGILLTGAMMTFNIVAVGRRIRGEF